MNLKISDRVSLIKNYFNKRIPHPFTTTLLFGISFVITQFCPIVTLSPILIGPIILVPAPMKTLFPIIAAPPIIFFMPNQNSRIKGTIITYLSCRIYNYWSPMPNSKSLSTYIWWNLKTCNM